jgi:hypothetical protein
MSQGGYNTNIHQRSASTAHDMKHRPDGRGECLKKDCLVLAKSRPNENGVVANLSPTSLEGTTKLENEQWVCLMWKFVDGYCHCRCNANLTTMLVNINEMNMIECACLGTY